VKRPHRRPALPLAVTALGLALAVTWDFASAASSARARAAEAQFRAAHPCPATGLTQGLCKGYVIDRIIPPVCGGTDALENMQWLTLAEAKAKARWERIGCRPGRKLVLPGESTSTTEAFPMGEAAAPVESQALPAGGMPPQRPAAPPAAEDADPELPHD
jgi:hypothetical protein